MYLGETPQGEDIEIGAEDLLTHGVVLGRTGSGKTGLTTVLIEEAAQAGASVIVFDPKGDLTNLGLSLATPQEFAAWTDHGEETYLRHGENLAHFGLGFPHVRAWRELTDLTIYAPGKTQGGGRSVNVFPSFAAPTFVDPLAHERASRGVGLILKSVANQAANYDPASVFLTQAVLHSWGKGRDFPVSAWPGVLTKPPQELQSFGGMRLNDFFPKAQRTKLARTLIGFQHQSYRWLLGNPLNIHALVEAPRPQVCVFTMRHLSEDDRQFFAGLLLHKIVEFMFETGASETLKLLVVLDEARGYLPPHPYNPPTKGPIGTILAQGRAQGVGMVVGTQNPMDLDYKALSNVGTWFVGRLRERDCARDLAGELRSRGVELEQVSDLPRQRFLLLDKRGGHHDLKVRWCYNYLKGPLSGQELLRIEPEPSFSPRRPSRGTGVCRDRPIPRRPVLSPREEIVHYPSVPVARGVDGPTMVDRSISAVVRVVLLTFALLGALAFLAVALALFA